MCFDKIVFLENANIRPPNFVIFRKRFLLPQNIPAKFWCNFRYYSSRMTRVDKLGTLKISWTDSYLNTWWELSLVKGSDNAPLITSIISIPDLGSGGRDKQKTSEQILLQKEVLDEALKKQGYNTWGAPCAVFEVPVPKRFHQWCGTEDHLQEVRHAKTFTPIQNVHFSWPHNTKFTRELFLKY